MHVIEQEGFRNDAVTIPSPFRKGLGPFDEDHLALETDGQGAPGADKLDPLAKKLLQDAGTYKFWGCTR